MHALPPDLIVFERGWLSSNNLLCLGDAPAFIDTGHTKHATDTVRRVRHSINPALEIEGVLMTMFDGRTNLNLQVVAQVKKHFKDKVFSTAIPRNVRLGEAPSHGLPISLYDPRSLGAEAYASLAKELIANNGK